MQKSIARFRIAMTLMNLALIYGCFLAGTNPLLAASGQSVVSPTPDPTNLVERLHRQFRDARTRFESDTNNFEAGWQFARACFDLAEVATNSAERALVAETGIAVSRRLIARNNDSVQAHYYLGLNLGQLARTKTFGALSIVNQMEAVFTLTRALDEHFDFAGSDRNLGLLYLEAPSFVSIGSKKNAREHLRRAVELAPEYPENRLNLIEAYLRWGERDLALREFRALNEQWAKAHETFSGSDWVESWKDWEKRFRSARAKLAQKAQN